MLGCCYEPIQSPCRRCVRTCLVVAMDQDNAQVGRLQLASVLDGHIVPLADVVDVDGNAGIGT